MQIVKQTIRRLRDRKQQPNKTVRNYVYSMKLIGSNYLDEAGLITYIIKGLHTITLARQFYTNLPSSITDFFEKANNYLSFEGMCTYTPHQKTTPSHNGKPEQKQNDWKGSVKAQTNTEQGEKTTKAASYATCLFCMNGEHRIKDCPVVICAKCQNKGHLTKDCPRNQIKR